MDELFDVFEDTPKATKNSQQNKKSKKRQANGDVKTADAPPQENGDALTPPPEPVSADDRTGVDEEQPDVKRQRRDTEPEPLVTDSFETEQSREVAASAGLQGQKEGIAVVLSHQVRHQVALPPDYSYVPISQHKPPEVPARTWPFTLDPFQQVSVASIERNESVLVSAHTSAGKTVVAEYAIAQCLKNNQRVIYTSPIKALSNQKYREFTAEFGDVGLMTGDVTINPTATCLVMTTEILRSMLYRGSEIMREVAWVIFDEVHYMRDKSRGVVWEETIILLPDKVRYVFLSATIPNAMQFAEWITKIHNQPCHVVYTDFRPTPLQHYLFPAGAEGIHLVVDEKGTFREENFQKAMTSIAAKQGDDPADPNAKRKGKGKDKKLNKGGNKGPSDIYKIVKMIMMKNYNPVIVFSFSKRECEELALQMSQLAFNDESEKAMVAKVFNSAIEMLSEEDRELPQIQHLLPLLRRGIGVHHSGLLPILKETIEILFQEGLIKVLFATETFSIGVNAVSNFCSRSSLPMTFAACAICRRSSSSRRNRRIKLPSYTSVILLDCHVSAPPSNWCSQYQDLPDLSEGSSLRPRVDDLHQLLLEASQILVFVDRELTLLRNLGDNACLSLDLAVGLRKIFSQGNCFVALLLKDEAAETSGALFRRQLVEEAVEQQFT